MIFVLIIHSLICVLLIMVVLMQSGRGGGLTDSFAAAENMFGTKTNDFMVRATVILTVGFLLTSLTLAHMSARRDQSLMDRLMDKTQKPDIQINIPTGDESADENAATETPAVPTEPAEPVAK